MSKIKLLLDVANDLKSLADSVQAVANAMSETETPPVKATSNQKEDVPNKPAKTTVSLEEVRAVLADKSRMGFTAQVRELLIKHSAEKLSAIDPAEYSILIAEAGGLR